MGLELMKNTLRKPPSTPLTSWLFRVYFYQDSYSLDLQLEENLVTATPIKIDLPKFETHIVTQKFFGGEKSFPVLRKHGGDTTLEFYAYSAQKENDFIVRNFIKTWDKTFLQGKGVYYRKEFYPTFNKIDAKLFSRTDELLYTYTFMNCITTSLELGTLNYEGDEVLRFVVGIHYDDWFMEVNSVTQDEKEKFKLYTSDKEMIKYWNS